MAERAEFELRMWRYFRNYRKQMIGCGVVAVIAAQLEAAALIIIVPLTQAVANGNKTSNHSFGPIKINFTVDDMILIAVTCIALATAMSLWFSYLKAKVGAEFAEEQRNLLTTDFLAADWPTQHSVRDGRLQQLSAFTARGAAVLTSLIGGMRGALTLIIFLAMALAIDWRSALAIIIAGVVLMFALRPLALRVRSVSKEMTGVQIAYAEELQDAANNSLDLRIFGSVDVVSERLTAMAHNLKKMRVRSGFLSGSMQPAYQYAGLLLVLVAVLVASRIDRLEIAALGAVALLLLRSLSYGQQIQTAYQTMLENTPFIEYVEDARRLYRENALDPGGIPLEAVRTLSFDGLSFSYDGDVEALDEVDLELHMGEVVGIVGPSGSGKSTLAQVLLRLRQPTAGELRVNGEPAQAFSLDSWYRRVTLVPQAPQLFHASVADNISLFRDETTRDEVIEAAKGAGVHEVIEALDDGYDTLIGQTFRDLSGGQVQRIGIARALARGADVLVLDEPTSALDVHSESLIQETLAALQGQVLLIVIAHRLSTLSICDRLVVLNEGRLEAAGPLSEVFEHNEFFRTAMDAGMLDLSGARPAR